MARGTTQMRLYCNTVARITLATPGHIGRQMMWPWFAPHKSAKQPLHRSGALVQEEHGSQCPTRETARLRQSNPVVSKVAMVTVENRRSHTRETRALRVAILATRKQVRAKQVATSSTRATPTVNGWSSVRNRGQVERKGLCPTAARNQAFSVRDKSARLSATAPPVAPVSHHTTSLGLRRGR